MINLFSHKSDPYGHYINFMRHSIHRYDQTVYRCPHCQCEHPAIPIGYISQGYRYTANYARCISCKRVMRRYGHSLEEFTIRQWVFTCMLGRYYTPNEHPYHTMNMRYPYPPMTHYAVFGTRD